MGKSSRALSFVGYLASASVFGLVVYFSYIAVQGPYGLLNLYKLEVREAQLLQRLDELTLQRVAAQNRAHRLSDEYLDLDLLDEQARKVLGLIRGDEIIIQ